jgi:vacuolar-type H+-ATPase subunit I/STV1
MIEQMTHVAVVGRAADRAAILSWLYDTRDFHPMSLEDGTDEAWKSSFAVLPDDSQAIDGDVARISAVLSFCHEFRSEKPGFLDAMLPLKVVGTRAELRAAVEEVNIDALHDETAAMRAAMEHSSETILRLKSKKNNVEQFAFLGKDLPAIVRLKNTVFDVVAVSGQGGKAFLLDERLAAGTILAEELFADQTHAYYGLAASASDADALRELIADHGLHQHPVPAVDRGAAEEIAALDKEIKETEAVLASQRIEAARFADAWQKKVGLAAGHYESEKTLAVKRVGMVASGHLFAARGYVKTDALEQFRSRLASAVPSAGAVPCDAPDGEEPPVSLKWNKWISPASLLVKMYGLPTYKSIDPTPYVTPVFFLFVGICLGDAVYGLLLIALMTFLKRKYREQAHLQDFFQCFLYCGIATVFIGILTGSWLGDITALIPGLGALDALRRKLMVIDMIKDAQLALYISIGIGVVTQIYGMAMLVYRNLRNGDKMGAFSDGALWICFLVFAILGGVTGWSFFWVLFIATLVALVLTQGRDQKNWFSRIMVGFIALYGIVGAYGASAILGDLISYARLMALCLTGAALGSTFNMLGSLSTDIPAVGVVLGVLVVIGGHLMSFFLNLLGGFVHSARLMMLEYFGRFYEAGGSAYRPYGFESASVDVKEQ